ELERMPGLHRRGGRLEVTTHAALRIGVDVVPVALAFALVVRVGDREQAVVEPDLRLDRVVRADPVDRALDLAVGAFHARTRLRIEPAAQLDHVALGILDHLVHAGDAGAAQAHFAAGHQALPAPG